MAALADDPDKAERVLKLPNTQLAAELVKLAKAGKTLAAPKVPKPARSAAPDLYDLKLTHREFIETRNAQERTRRQPPAPAKVDIRDPKISLTDFIRARDEWDRSRRAAKGHR